MTDTAASPDQLWKFIQRPMNDAQRRMVGDACRALLEQSPDDPTALATYGFYFARLGKHEDARPLLERANNLKPNSGKTIHALALCYVGLGLYAKADTLLKKLLAQTGTNNISINRNNLELVSALGLTALALGRMEEAQALYRAVIDVTVAALRKDSAANPTPPPAPLPEKPRRLVHNLLYLPVEVKARELDSKLLVAASAAAAGMNVVLGASPMLAFQGYTDLPAGIVLFKTLNSTDASMMGSAIGGGHVIAVIDEEAVGRASDERVYRYNVDTRSVGLADLILAQGDEQIEIMGSLFPQSASIMKRTGNPKSDLLKLLRKPESYTAKGPIVICLMSGNINPNAWSFASCVISTLRLSGLFLDSKIGQDFIDVFKACVAFEIAIAPQIKEAVCVIAKEFSDRKILVRPHPVESPVMWQSAFADIPNVSLHTKGALTDLLGEAAAVIYVSGSTSGVESYLAGAPSIRFTGDGTVKDIGNGFSSVIGKPARNGREAVDHLNRILNLESSDTGAEGDEDFVSRFLYRPSQGLVCQEMAAELSTLHKLHAAPQQLAIEELTDFNERRSEPFRPLEFHLGKFPETGADEILQKINALAAEAAIHGTFSVKKIEFNSFLIQKTG